MSSWQETADEAIAHNVADVMEHGPRLTTNRMTAELAIDRRNKRVLKTGLGAQGVGTMWCRYYDGDEQPEWADLPERDSTGEFGDEAIALTHAQRAALVRYGYDPGLPPRGCSGPPGVAIGWNGQLLRNHVCELDGIEIDGHEGSDLDPGSTACIHCDYQGPNP